MKRKREGKETEMATLTSSGHDDGSGRGYEVFLNFRGPDTRLTIADSLYNTMIRVGICAFKDDEELRFGEEIGGGLLQAINNSRIYIPIFSKDYASSKWCLRELSHMVECARDDHEKVILPIFFDVDADDVRLKTELYWKALRQHKSDVGKDLAKKWKKALREVAKIKGRNLKDHGLYELINLTVKEVSSLLWPKWRVVPDHLVGIKDRADEIMKLLDLRAFDVRFIVIHGMGGIGKTTLAEAVFKQISPQFHGHCCFLKDVRAHDTINLQKKLLSEILNPSCINLSFIDEGADVIKTKFHGKKLLIVLDGIDNRDQIMRLAGGPNWFGGGSRIIITTRNIEFLVKEGKDDNVPTSNNGHFMFYDMPEMNWDDALQLFCERALGSAKPPPDYMDISKKLINALGGLPLALDVVGSTLHGKCRSTWESVLNKLKKVMNEDVKKKLMISYEALEPNQQEIYLDIACFFIHEKKTRAIKYWDAVFGYPTEFEVNILKHMSLIKISHDDRLWMHNQLRELGRNIVHPESREVHLRGSRLWFPKDAFSVVQRESGIENVVALNLGTLKPNVVYRFKCKQFMRMVNLRFLQLYHGYFEGDFKDLFSELRWLSWHNCPSEFRATNFGLKNLAVLQLYTSNITEDWGGWCQIMVAKQLKILELVNCPFLRKTPKLFSFSGLERLILRGCTRLRKIDKSIGNLQHLDHLVIEGEAIESLPKSIGGLKSLTKLRIKSKRLSVLPHSIGNLVNLKHLTISSEKLAKLPDSIGHLESLLKLDVSHTRIRELPFSIGSLARLESFAMPNRYLEKLPDSIRGLQSLRKLDLSYSKIRSLPDSIGNLKKLKVLDISNSNISELPKTIGMLENLEQLHAGSEHLEGEIPSEIGALSLLNMLDLSHGRFTGLPATINQLTNLQALSLSYGESIRQLPELPKSLKALSVSLNSLATVPDFSNLTNLARLAMHGTPVRALRNLPLINLSFLSQLEYLQRSYADSPYLTRLPSGLRKLTLTDVQSPIDWSFFSHLENLSNLGIDGYSLGEIQFEAFGKPRNLIYMSMINCPLLKMLPLPPFLKELQCLYLKKLP